MVGTQMKPLRIKDNSSFPQESFSEIPLLTKRIADQTLKQLELEGVFVFPELIRKTEDKLHEEQGSLIPSRHELTTGSRF